MTSTYTASAFVARGGYSDETRKHPALDFIEHCGKFFDSHDFTDTSKIEKLSDWYTKDFSFHTPHGEQRLSHSSSDFDDDHALISSVAKFWGGPLAKWRNAATQLIVVDSQTKDGYDLYYVGDLFANVAGTPADGEETVKDERGQEWDLQIPAFIHFELRKEEGGHRGLKMCHVAVIKDTGIINGTLDKRNHGHVKTV